MDTTVDIQPMVNIMNAQSELSSEDISRHQKAQKNKRGRPKGAKTTSLAEVRKQAAEEKSRLRLELGNKIKNLQDELEELKLRYEDETSRLSDQVEALRRREQNYQLALGEKLREVADHLQTTLINWGTAELEEAQIDKRGRGRPRKTLK